MLKKMLSLFLLFSLFSAFSSINLVAGGQKDNAELASGETRYLEIFWGGYNEKNTVTKDNPFVQRAVEALGVGYEMPLVSWNSGNDYTEKLRLRLAAGDPPDIFRLPNFGFSIAELVEGGVAADLTEKLPNEAPYLVEVVDEIFWKIVKADSPEEGKIYYLPALRKAPTHGAFIRQDWLERINMDIPETEESFHQMLKAFKDQDANGNGDPGDEIPTGGRGPGRWWDHLFTPYGVAMMEGFPSWDYYDGELQYSAVQPEMKKVIEKIVELYNKGLIDPEVLINKSNTWQGKYLNNQVGVWFHMPIYVQGRIQSLYSEFPNSKLTWFPPYKVEGVDDKWNSGYVAVQNTGERVVIANKDEQTINDALHLLDYIQRPEVIKENLYGIEGLHYKEVNGDIVFRTDNLSEQEELASWFARSPLVTTTDVLKSDIEVSLLTMEDQEMADRLKEDIFNIIDDAKVIQIPGTNLPQSIYDGYPDIATHKLYFEYLAKIMLGTLDIDAWDEFVQRWYDTGGAVVTKRAQETAAKIGLE